MPTEKDIRAHGFDTNLYDVTFLVIKGTPYADIEQEGATIIELESYLDIIFHIEDGGDFDCVISKFFFGRLLQEHERTDFINAAAGKVKVLIVVDLVFEDFIKDRAELTESPELYSF